MQSFHANCERFIMFHTTRFYVNALFLATSLGLRMLSVAHESCSDSTVTAEYSNNGNKETSVYRVTSKLSNASIATFLP